MTDHNHPQGPYPLKHVKRAASLWRDAYERYWKFIKADSTDMQHEALQTTTDAFDEYNLAIAEYVDMGDYHAKRIEELEATIENAGGTVPPDDANPWKQPEVEPPVNPSLPKYGADESKPLTKSHKQWGANPELTSGDRYENMDFYGNEWVGVHNGKDELLTDVLFTNCVIRDARMWASRMYRAKAGISFIRCTIRNVLKEHAFYPNLAGLNGEKSPHQWSMAFRNCLLENIGSQGFQFVGAGMRPGETPDPVGDNTPGLPILIDDCKMRNVGAPGGTRQSFHASFFQAKHNVVIDGLVDDASDLMSSRGLGLCEGFKGNGFKREIVIAHHLAMADEVTQPVWQLQDVHRIEMQGCDYQINGGQNFLHITNPRGLVNIEGCKGDTRIKINGKDVGGIDKGHVKDYTK